MISLVSLIVNVKIEVDTGYDAFNVKGNQMVDLAEATLSNPLWEYNISSISNIIEAIGKDKEVALLYVYDANKNLLASVDKRSNSNDYNEAYLRTYPGIKNDSFAFEISVDNNTAGFVELALTDAYIRQDVRRVILASFLEATIIIFVQLILVIFFVKITVKSLEKITDVTKHIGQGHYDLSVPKDLLKSGGEIGVLSQSVEHMRIVQQELFREIKERNEHLDELVEERTNQLALKNSELTLAIRQLKDAQSELIRKNRTEAVHKMIIELSHRINTPLGNGVLCLSYLEKRLNKNKKEGLSHILVSEIEDCVDMAINSIRLTSEITGALKSVTDNLSKGHLEVINVKQIISDALKISKSKYDVNNIFFYDVTCENNNRIISNKLLVYNVLEQFVSMVIRSNEDVIKLYIKIESAENSIIIDIYGPTLFLSFNNKQNIFEPYTVQSFKSNEGGLELYFIKNILELGLKGSIDFVADQENPYFRLKLPFEDEVI